MTDKINNKVTLIVKELQTRLEQQVQHAQNMLEAANERVELYPHFRQKETAIVRRWENELAARQRVLGMLRGLK